MSRIRALLCGLSLFYATFWLPVAVMVYTPFSYDLSCRLHSRCAHWEEGPPHELIRQLASYLTHTGQLSAPAWTEKERQHLAEARARLDVASWMAVAALFFLGLTATRGMLRRSALINLFIFPFLTGVFPFFKTFWREVFHPLLFSNHLWLNTPLDVSYYLMPRTFFFWMIALGIGCAMVLNGCLLGILWRKGKGPHSGTTDQTSRTGDAMKRMGWMALGLVLGVVLTLGYRMVTEERRLALTLAEAVAEKARFPVGDVSPSSEGRAPALMPEVADEGKPFTPDMDRLRESLPGNLALPPKDEDEQWLRSEEKKSRNELYGRISANIASEDEVHSYYEEQALLTRDSIAMLEWILTEYEGEMGERDLARHRFLLEQFQKRLAAIPDRQARVLARMKEKNTNMPSAGRG
ncbi:DUF1461 domain-containing protein [Desulfoluna sp.]|uniref:lipoprotein intramolecular transacylase Lit n=1 Tax=Desulfoluna sp. TaxID=2045199 RepID=UPI002623006B|nr:DUF1461 domain-containing protein [Desulfoluna sp.]